MERLRPLVRRLAFLGMIAGLGRTVLKCTLPGIPDTYQGTEFWDFSFVDPDNRRPVDYAERARALEAGGTPDALIGSWQDGRVKQATLARLLADRAARPAFYADADYRPLPAEGARADHVIAFTRSAVTSGEDDLLVAVPRLVARMTSESGWSSEAFAGTVLPVPAGSRWVDVVGGGEITAEGDGLDLGRHFAKLPYLVLRRAA
jgi:(1->4)-alpha-D-glucan 1-alpha-D-glucosylmutase